MQHVKPPLMTWETAEIVAASREHFAAAARRRAKLDAAIDEARAAVRESRALLAAMDEVLKRLTTTAPAPSSSAAVAAPKSQVK
jgi:hypothetical protein